MSEKLADYTGRRHLLWNYIKEKWQECSFRQLKDKINVKSDCIKDNVVFYLNQGENEDDFSHLNRKKTTCELVRISAAVMGIEFCYAAETAFGSPTMLKIGIHHSQMSLIWCLSPLLGFFLTPILGSLSDKCRSSLGRRRPFIIALSIVTVFGLCLVPNGKAIGIALGDNWGEVSKNNNKSMFMQQMDIDEEDYFGNFSEWNSSEIDPIKVYPASAHPWTVFFTILGMMSLDFSADACQSPSRAYLLDITIPEDHASGLSTFTILAGLGGFFGYAMGAINWENTFFGLIFGGHLRTLFALVTFIFIGCVLSTLLSFREIPLDILLKLEAQKKEYEEDVLTKFPGNEYGTIQMVTHSNDTSNNEEKNQKQEAEDIQETSFGKEESEVQIEESTQNVKEASVTLKQYLFSIIYMPYSMRMLCLTNLFSWMSLVCYSLNFTDFVGEAVFGGDFMAPSHSEELKLFEDGVRFGCWGMAMYSLSCSAYSFIIEKLVNRFGARPVYICGPLVYSVGMLIMGLIKSKVVVILLSTSAGIMYSTLFTMPYLIIAHYHATGLFNQGPKEEKKAVRGLGTDVAIVSSMVFLAQFILSASIGTIIEAVKSTVAVVYAASLLSFCAAVSAAFVTYRDL